MNESLRTIVYAVVAIAAIALAWMVRPAAVKFERLDDSGERFFDQFDPLDAKSLEIVSVNPESMQRRTFQVAQKNGRWSIPSREDYPADAQDQVAKAAVSVMDLTKGSVISDSPADHEMYGVADPNAATEGSPPLGSGMRVTLLNEGNRTLVDFIIGKSVKDSPTQRYVRIPGRDRVYVATVSTEALSTKFEDWIERDLLKLAGVPISEIIIEDYAVDMINQRINRGESVHLQHDPATATWSLAAGSSGNEGLKEGESINSAKVDQMRDSLANLQIVDVHRKPAGLSSQLQLEDNMSIDAESLASLAARGFYIANGQLFSNQGETIVRTNQGVEYTLRFGEVTTFESGTAGGEAESASSMGNGRFVFVTVNFNQSLIAQPEYESVPETTEATESDEAFRALRDEITKRNETKRTEYETKVNEGREKAKTINARMADWYYVVSDEIYRQIRLKRSDVVTTGETPSIAPPVSDS